MRKSQILEYWMSRYGQLSGASRERFLRRQEVARLTRYPDAVVRAAIGWSNLLADALSFAHSAYEGDPKPLPPEPSVPSARHEEKRRSPTSRPWQAEREAGARRPVDTDLARKIGPVQRYEDDF